MSLLQRARGYVRVEMDLSVVGPVAGRAVNLEAGRVYWLKPEVVDELVLKGYGRGTITHPYSDKQIARLIERSQSVNIGTGEVSGG